MLCYQEDDFRPIGRMAQGGYGAYNAYISAATRYAAIGAPTLYDHPGSMYGSKYLLRYTAIYSCDNMLQKINFFLFVGLGGESTRGMGKKIFVGRLPQEATIEDLRQYFGRFGRILDVYIPRVKYHSSVMKILRN